MWTLILKAPADNFYPHADTPCMCQVYFAHQHPKYPAGGKMSQYIDSLKVRCV